MIDEALKFLRDHLNASLKGAGSPGAGAAPELVTFVDGDKVGDAVGFTPGAVSMMLVRIEEESTLRPADPYARPAADGSRQRVRPEVRLNLYVLFVAQFRQYVDSLRWLSAVVAHFQHHRVFTPASAPALSPRIEQLLVELVTLPFSEQNEVWGALRTSYRPSALYRLRMVVFRDEHRTPEPVLEEVRIELPA